jgi:very-short-patch-repair endonuclease
MRAQRPKASLVARSAIRLSPVGVGKRARAPVRTPVQKGNASHLEAKISHLLHTSLPLALLDDLRTQHRFHIPKEGEKRRRWAFDFAFPSYKVAVEAEGGLYMKGRGGYAKGHAHPRRLEEDMVKYNAAALQGWTLLRFGTKLVTEHPEYILRCVKEALGVV